MYSIQPSFQYTQWVFTFVVIIFSRVIPCLSQHWYMTRINKVYDRHMPRFLCSSMNCVFTAEITMKLPRLVWTNMYSCIKRRGMSHNPLKSMFYWAVLYDRYMSGICMAYIFSRCWSRCWTFPLQHASSGHFWSSKRAGPLQTWTFCESVRSWRLKGHSLEAGACQSSTARRWSHKHGCVIPCV